MGGISYIYDKVDIIGVHNKQLKNPVDCFEQREVPLTGNEIINGEFLLYEYIGHTGDTYIKEFNSIDEIENEIISGSGLTNTFTTYQLAIIKGTVKVYSIFFTNGVDGNEYKFVKGYHDDFELANQFEFTNIRIEWI